MVAVPYFTISNDKKRSEIMMIHNNNNNNIFVSGDLLQVRSHGSAPRYDVIRIVHGRSQRAPNMARTHANARGDLVLARMALGKCPQGGKMDLNNKSKKLVLGHPCEGALPRCIKGLLA